MPEHEFKEGEWVTCVDCDRAHPSDYLEPTALYLVKSVRGKVLVVQKEGSLLQFPYLKSRFRARKSAAETNINEIQQIPRRTG